MTVRFTIHGAPRTKKTSNRIVRAGKRLRVLPSAAHEEWYERAYVQVTKQAIVYLTSRYMPITSPVTVRALFYRDANRGDATGYYQALADLLERASVIENDRLIRDWDGSRLLKDAANPRIEIEITEVES